MTSLPKRGDRVRVTEFMAKRGVAVVRATPVVLTEDARDHGEGYVSFRYLSPASETFVGPVKVEILERAGASKVEIIERDGYKFTLTCRKCGLAMMLEAGPLQRADTTIDTCALCDEKSAEFARGMRRAVEIAEGLPWQLSKGDYLVEKLKEAVEKELKS